MKEQIIFGLPKGSLNNETRGNTCQLLKDAGYDITGYEPGKEQPSRLAVLNDLEIKPVLVRPQSAPKELYDGVIDIAIFGSDWWKEWEIAGYGVEKLAQLGYGNTKIVLAGNRDLKEILGNEQIVCYSEYVNLASYSLESLTKKKPSLEIRGFKIQRDPSIRVVFSDGETEGYVQKGLADLVVECTQSGKSLEEYGLRSLLLLLEPVASLYINPGLNGWKRAKAELIKDALVGAAKARNFDYLVFNVPSHSTEAMVAYLSNSRLFADEPTINYGREWNQFSIMVPKEKYPVILDELRRFGAKSILRLEPKQII